MDKGTLLGLDKAGQFFHIPGLDGRRAIVEACIKRQGERPQETERVQA